MGLKITSELTHKGFATIEAYVYIEEYCFDKTEKVMPAEEGEEPENRISLNVGVRPYFSKDERVESPENFAAFGGIKTYYALYLTLDSILELGIFGAAYAELRLQIKADTGIPLSKISNLK